MTDDTKGISTDSNKQEPMREQDYESPDIVELGSVTDCTGAFMSGQFGDGSFNPTRYRMKG